MSYPDIDVLLFPKDFRTADDEGLYSIDKPADVVGNASGGIRGVGTLLNGNDFHFRLLAASLGGAAHPCRIPSDDN
jgi:hypothetical protein